MTPNIIGIVAEYNPFHFGHLHHISETKRLTNADAVIVVLSSDFVQRGEAALLSKHDRAKIAVECGADLVIELPAIFSCHNAGVFANATIDMLNATGIVNHISFGVEHTDWDLISAAHILIDEPETFKSCITKNLDLGFSFVESRALAFDAVFENGKAILSGSNNALALNYVMRIIKTGSKMKITTVKRKGADYSSEIAENGSFASATAIRKIISEGNTDKLPEFMPEISAKITEERIKTGKAITNTKKLWELLRSQLLRHSAQKLAEFAEISEGIEYKFKKEALTCQSFEEWLEKCSSKRYPKGRIRRQAMHILFALNHFENRAFQRIGPAYLRILAANSIGRKILKQMKEKSTLPVISRCGEAKFSSYAESIMRYDLLACELRNQMLPNPTFGSEHSEKIYLKG